MSIVSDDSSARKKGSILSRKMKRKNRVTSPEDISPTSTSPTKDQKTDIIEMFTIQPSSLTRHPIPAKRKGKSAKVSSSISQDLSELSDEVFTNTPKQASNAASPTKSEISKSYRNKINERFESVRRNAGKSSEKANVFQKADTKKLMLDRVRRENDDIEAELETVRSRFKLSERLKSSELYDFFCNEKTKDEQDEDVKEEFTKSTDRLDGDESEVKYFLPEFVNGNIKDSEQKLYFHPNARPVDVSDKIEGDEPRNLEEEGFFVHKLPKVPVEHLNLIEQRLSRDNKKWFNCEGKLDIAENPIKKSSIRPYLKPLSSEMTVTYLPAKIENNECEEIVVIRDNILQIQISTLKFTHHPLFSLEHVFAFKLEQLIKKHDQITASNNLERLKQKLEATRQLKRKHDILLAQSGDQKDKKSAVYTRDIKRLQELLFDEGKTERQLLKSILQTWKIVKKIRKQNGYSGTSIKLNIGKEETDYEQEKENFDGLLEGILNDCIKRRPSLDEEDEDEIRSDLTKKFRESFKPPGEPIIRFRLSPDNEIDKDVDNPKEILRRNVVASTKVALRILCNKIEVCKTKPVNLNESFSCDFNENISVQLSNIPKFITIEIIEQPKSLVRRTVGTVEIKLPSKNICGDNRKFTEERFEKNEIVHYKHEGVGSGVKIKDVAEGIENDDDELKTSGVLTAALHWDVASNGEDTLIASDEVVHKIIDKNGTINCDKLMEWLNHNQPDPQDPKNAVFYEFAPDDIDNEVAAMTNKKTDYFRLSPHLESLQFCNPSVLEENLRLKILQLRDNNEPEFDQMTVPNRIKEIPLNVLADYKQRKAEEIHGFDDYEDEDDEIQTRRNNGRKALKQIHIKIFQKCKNTQNNLAFEDVVDEKLLVYFEKFIKHCVQDFINWFRWHPLRPQLQQARSQKLHDNFQQNILTKVVIKVNSAINVPERVGEGKDELSPFVEIEYGNVVTRTATSRGTNPTWNEELILPLESLHVDYLNPNSLNGTITIGIFDEHDKDLTKFGGIKGKTWLGSVEIPLSTACYNEIDGLFEVKTAFVSFGHEDQAEQKQTKTNGAQQSPKHCYLNMNISIQPNVPKLSFNMEELPCNDVPYIKDHALKWNQNYNMNYPDRKFSVFAIDTAGTISCVVHYIKPLEPPQINVEGFDVTPEQCVRYVSLIPFTECNKFYQNIWLSVDQFLHLMLGSVIDHCIALTCYLLALKLDVWLLLGYGIPSGSTAFVLRREHDNSNSSEIPTYHVYDVVNNKKFSLTDIHCPLQKIYCVINEHNVWANVQRNDNMNIMRFDLSRKSDWLPLFDNQVSVPTNSIHGKIKYLPKVDVNQLEILLDRKLKKKISKLRPLDRTIWNRQVSSSVKNILNSFENNVMFGQSNAEMMVKLKKHLSSFEINGHILNLPYKDVSSIVKRVKSLGLHMQDDPDIEFAVAVYLKCYPNQVITVWICLASVHRSSVLQK